MSAAQIHRFHERASMKPSQTLKSLALAAALGAAALSAVQAAPVDRESGPNLVANGGFESGDFAGWDAGAVSFLSGVDGLSAHSGDFGAFGGEGVIRQHLTTVPGAHYNIHFWLRNDGSLPNRFFVQWDGATVFDSTGMDAFEYTEFVIDPLASGALTELVIGFRNDFGFIEFDDIAVRVTPEPGSLGLLAAGLFAAARRRRAARAG